MITACMIFVLLNRMLWRLNIFNFRLAAWGIRIFLRFIGFALAAVLAAALFIGIIGLL